MWVILEGHGGCCVTLSSLYSVFSSRTFIYHKNPRHHGISEGEWISICLRGQGERILVGDAHGVAGNAITAGYCLLEEAAITKN